MPLSMLTPQICYMLAHSLLASDSINNKKKNQQLGFQSLIQTIRIQTSGMNRTTETQRCSHSMKGEAYLLNISTKNMFNQA